MPIRRLRIRNKKVAIALSVIGLAALLCLAGPWSAAEFCRFRGTAALNARNEDLALDWLRIAERFQRDSGLTQFLLARTYRRIDRFADMQRHLERAVALGFSRERADREEWLSLAQFGKTDQLGSRLQALLDNPGEDGREVLAALASGFTRSLDLDCANLVLGEWMARYPDDVESYICAAQFRQSLGEWPAAVELYRRSLPLASRRTAVRLGLAQCLARSNNPAAAEPEFRRCLAEQPESVEASLGLGTCLVNLGRLDEARTVLAEALRRDPYQFDVARSLGELELSEGKSDAALEMLAPLAERWPRDRQLCTLIARALQESGQADRAQPYFDEADRAMAALTQVDELIEKIKRNRDDIGSRYELGALLMAHLSREQGVGWLQSVLLYDPRHRAAHLALADFYERSGNSKLAQMHRDQAAESAENDREP